MLKILICGTRDREPVELLRKILATFPLDTLVIAGAAKGVDRTAAMVAVGLGLQVQEFPALWDVYGKGAGPIRNQQMLDQGPDIVIAFHNDPGLGKGTRDMVARARKAGVPVFVFMC